LRHSVESARERSACFGHDLSPIFARDLVLPGPVGFVAETR
jgi:hypothetical protein